jgi:predicted amidophosphoribosyltransferase
VLRLLLDAIAPPACVACGEIVGGAADLCGDCRRGVVWLGADVCSRCALPRPCGPPCPAANAAFAAAWAPVAYDGTGGALVAALKFGGRLAVADTMAAQIAANAPPGLLADAVLVPVPTHPSRRRARGFDQAERLAVALRRRTGLPVVRALTRHGPPARQVGAGRSERRTAGRMRVTARGVPGAAVLVDDVHTTGATLEACAAALRRAGADRVTAVTYARTLR